MRGFTVYAKGLFQDFSRMSDALKYPSGLAMSQETLEKRWNRDNSKTLWFLAINPSLGCMSQDQLYLSSGTSNQMIPIRTMNDLFFLFPIYGKIHATSYFE